MRFILALIGLGTMLFQVAPAAAEDGKHCHMVQQCHWKDFKKICTWVKVCR